MGELSKKLGKRIKEIRESLNMKQYQLAEILNMEPSNLTRIEAGLQLPKEENLVKISSAFGVEVCDLFDFSEKYNYQEIKDKIIKKLEEFSASELEFLYKFLKMYKIEK